MRAAANGAHVDPAALAVAGLRVVVVLEANFATVLRVRVLALAFAAALSRGPGTPAPTTALRGLPGIRHGPLARTSTRLARLRGGGRRRRPGRGAQGEGRGEVPLLQRGVGAGGLQGRSHPGAFRHQVAHLLAHLELAGLALTKCWVLAPWGPPKDRKTS